MTVVAPFIEADRDEVIALILAIQADDLGGADSEEEIADLRAVAAIYQHDAGGFWVARDGGRIVGTVALKDIGGGDVFLKRMYVAASHRGPGGIAARLLDVAVDWARLRGARAVYLGTMAEPPMAPRFYRKHGFQPIDRERLPADAVVAGVDDCFLRLRLG